MSDVQVLGGGAWGRALAAQALRAGRSTTIVTRDLSRNYPAGARISAVGVPAALTLVCVPLAALGPVAGGDVVACCKGMDARGRLPLEILGAPAAILSGPNFAAEIEHGLPAAATIASADVDLRARVIAALATENFRLYGNDDPTGVQLCGAAKNVIAIGAGIVTGAALGENARAALIARGLAEIARLVTALGGRTGTVMGLAGLGDLLLTATGPQSRNFTLGFRIGQGRTAAEALAASSGVAEGATTAPALIARAAAAGIELPVCAVVARVLAGDMDVADATACLLARKLRDE